MPLQEDERIVSAAADWSLAVGMADNAWMRETLRELHGVRNVIDGSPISGYGSRRPIRLVTAPRFTSSLAPQLTR